MPHLIFSGYVINYEVFTTLCGLYIALHVAPYTELFDLYAQVAMIDKLVMQWCVKIMSN